MVTGSSESLLWLLPLEAQLMGSRTVTFFLPGLRSLDRSETRALGQEERAMHTSLWVSSSSECGRSSGRPTCLWPQAESTAPAPSANSSPHCRQVRGARWRCPQLKTTGAWEVPEWECGVLDLLSVRTGIW